MGDLSLVFNGIGVRANAPYTTHTHMTASTMVVCGGLMILIEMRLKATTTTTSRCSGLPLA